MRKLLLAVALFPASAMCQLNPYIPLMIRPPVFDNPIDQLQQLEQIRANRAIADQIQAQRQAQIDAEAQRQKNKNAEQAKKNMDENAIAQAWKEKAMKRSHLYKDFESVVFAEDVSFNMNMIKLMSMSDYAADIAYYFGTHKIEAVAVANMSILDAANRISAIEQTFYGK